MDRFRKKSVVMGLSCGLVAGTLGLSAGASAAPGDPTMSGGVKWSQGFSLSYDVAVTANGKIFLGFSSMASPGDVQVKRYNSTGDLTATIEFGDPVASTSLVDLEAVGRRVYVVLQTLSEKGFSIARLDAAGEIDTSWGGDGEVEATAVNDAEIGIVDAVAMPDGGLAVVTDDTVYVFDADGSMDESFSGDGIATVPMPKGGQVMAIDSYRDGSLVFAGAAGLIERTGVVSRLDAAGNKVDGFGRRSFVRRDYPNAIGAGLSRVEFDSTGRIVVGTVYSLGEEKPTRLGVGRLRKSGRVDTSFSGDGWASYSLDSGDMWGMEIVVQPDDKVVVLGGSGLSWSALRLHVNGQRDKAFGDEGIVTLEGGERETAFVLHAEVDKRNDQIVMVGASPLEDAEEGIGLAGISMS